MRAAITQGEWQRYANLGYKPNEWSYDHVHLSTARFNAFVTCRQCGKTETAAQLLDTAMEAEPDEFGRPPQVGVLSFDFDHAFKPIRRYRDKIHKLHGEDYYEQNLNDHRIYIPSTGAELLWFSSSDEMSVTGNTFSYLLIDEAQSVPDIVWNKIVPSTTVRRARIDAFGTPDTDPLQTWFRGLFLRGQGEKVADDINPDTYNSFTLSCWDNPWADYEAIMEAMATMSEREFRMLMMGEWVDSEGKVFKKAARLFTGEWAAPNPEHTYVMSLDIAKLHDYTVIYVLDQDTHEIVFQDRFNGLDYVELAFRVRRTYNAYQPRHIIVDTTGLGEPVADMLRHMHIPLLDYTFSAKSKQKLIQNLVRATEKGEIHFPRKAKQLKMEMEVFEASVTGAGNVVYGAPVNFFDDCVISAALVAMADRQRGSLTQSTYASW